MSLLVNQITFIFFLSFLTLFMGPPLLSSHSHWRRRLRILRRRSRACRAALKWCSSTCTLSVVSPTLPPRRSLRGSFDAIQSEYQTFFPSDNCLIFHLEICLILCDCAKFHDRQISLVCAQGQSQTNVTNTIASVSLRSMIRAPVRFCHKNVFPRWPIFNSV